MMNEATTAPRLIGFAGHRRVPNREDLARAIRSELEGLRDLFGPRLTAISSAAAGADLIFLKTCAELRIPAIVILPFGKKRFSEDFVDPQEWRLAETLLRVALAVYVIKGGHEAPQAYQVVSRQLLEWADAFLFAWDGQPAGGPGGTGETVEDATDTGIPARIVDATSLETRWTFKPDTNRRARHGFDTRLDLLAFLDARLDNAVL
jgi:hypothetical protein